MTETEAILLFKCLSDATRLQLVKALSDGPKYVELLSELLDRTPSTISFHLKKLAQAGAVSSYKSQYYTMYALNREVLNTGILDLILEKSDEAETQAQRDAAYRQKVIDSFFEYGKLKSIPVQRKKERVILEFLAEKFEFGRIYTEREVNLIIADFHDDFCTLRRDMISEKLLDRNRDGYWRVK